MKQISSIPLFILGIVLLLAGANVSNVYLQYSLLFTSMIVNIMAVIRSFKEKNEL